MSVEELESIILKSTVESSSITKSVQELPVVKIIPLLQAAEQLLREEKEYVTDLGQKLAYMAEWMQKRSRNLTKILQLQGRADLIGQQMELRAEPVTFAREEPLINMES